MTNISIKQSADNFRKQNIWLNYTIKETVVLNTTPIYYGLVSGGDLLFPEIVKRLNLENYKVKVITTYVGNELYWKNFKNIQIIIIPQSSFEQKAPRLMIPLIYLFRVLPVILNLIRLSRNQRVVLYSSSNFLSDILPPYILKLFRPRVKWITRVYHLISPPMQRKGKKIINLLSYAGDALSLQLIKRSDLVLVLNEFTLNNIISRGFSNDKVDILGAGIDISFIDSIKYEGPKIYEAMFVGRIDPNKGISDILEIVIGIRRTLPNIKVAIVGGGEKEAVNWLNAKIDEYGLKDAVKYLGYIPLKEDVIKIMKSSNIFLFTDHEAGWGLAVTEAMACGIPVIGYALEIFGNVYKEGFVPVKPFDAGEFANKVIMLLSNKELLNKLSQEAREQSLKFNLQKVANDFGLFVNKLFEQNETIQ